MSLAMALMLLGWIVLTWTSASASKRPVNPDMVLRQHYGVVFTPLETFTPTTGYWLHTFAFSLPHRPSISDKTPFNCSDLSANPNNANATHCLHVKPFVDRIQFNTTCR